MWASAGVAAGEADCSGEAEGAGIAPLHSIVGVEVSASAVEAARRNARANGVANVRFLSASAEAIFDGLEFGGERAAAIVDPPRKGCGEAFLAQLVRFAPRRIVYVSCAPDTQARDLKALLAAGYALRHVQPFDMFPHTRHLESVATLEWPEAGTPTPTPIATVPLPRRKAAPRSRRARRAGQSRVSKRDGGPRNRMDIGS